MKFLVIFFQLVYNIKSYWKYSTLWVATIAITIISITIVAITLVAITIIAITIVAITIVAIAIIELNFLFTVFMIPMTWDQEGTTHPQLETAHAAWQGICASVNCWRVRGHTWWSLGCTVAMILNCNCSPDILWSAFRSGSRASLCNRGHPPIGRSYSTLSECVCDWLHLPVTTAGRLEHSLSNVSHKSNIDRDR